MPAFFSTETTSLSLTLGLSESTRTTAFSAAMRLGACPCRRGVELPPERLDVRDGGLAGEVLADVDGGHPLDARLSLGQLRHRRVAVSQGEHLRGQVACLDLPDHRAQLSRAPAARDDHLLGAE